jgi:uncharacterized membrane protein YfhO
MPFFNRTQSNGTQPSGAPRTALRDLLFYTLFFAAFFCICFLPGLLKNGFILGGDGYNMYYPITVNCRDTLRDFFRSIADGHPKLQLMNFYMEFGRDNYTMLCTLIAYFPFYVFTVFMSDAALPTFLTVTAFILDFLAGAAFIRMCRYFRNESKWVPLMAVAYAFCPNFINNALYNPQFMCMLVSFPLMVVGLDRVLKKQGWKLLAVCVCWLSLTSFTYLVYTLPLLAVFALLRIWFTQRQGFFVNLIKAFLRCLPILICGMLLAGVMMLPTLYCLRHSIRTVGSDVNLLNLLIPEESRLNSVFMDYSGVGPLFIAYPGFLLFFLLLPKHRELRGYVFAMALLLMTPFTDYALNGFQYSLIRWGFIPALLFCYAAAVGMDALGRLSRRHTVIFIAALVFYAVTFSSYYDIYDYAGTACSVIFLVWAVCAAIPPVRRFFSRMIDRLQKAASGFIGLLRDGAAGARHYLALGGLVLLLSAVGAAVLLIVLLPNYEVFPQLLSSVGIVIVLLILLAVKPNWKRIALPVSGLCLLGAACWVYFGMHKAEYSPITETAIVHTLRNLPVAENSFGRTIGNDYFVSTPEEIQQKDAALEEEDQMINRQKSGTFSYTNTNYVNQIYAFSPDCELDSNYALVYRYADCTTFDNLADDDLLNLFERTGQHTDYSGITGFSGFSGKAAYHTLFGINTVSSYKDLSAEFGLTCFREPDADEENNEEKFYLYRNEYAFPVGVTYDSYMTDAEYDALSSAVLPYAMLGYATVGDGRTPASDGSVMDLEQYKADYKLEKTYEKTTTTGMDIYEHLLTFNSDVSDCFLCLTFNDAFCNYPEDYLAKGLRINVDGLRFYHATIVNNKGQWPWLRDPHCYAIELGVSSEPVHQIRFTPPMEYSSFEVYAIPTSVLTDAYAARTAETLENVRFGTDTLDGDITVSSEKLLSVGLLHNDGWRVLVDGVEQPLEKVNRLFIGVMLPAGTHHVQFVYFTPWLKAGLICSACGVLLWIALVIIWRKRRSDRKEAAQ